MKPIIGLTASYEPVYAQLKHTYAQSVLRAGGMPVTMPFLEDAADLEQLCDRLDGLLLTGGPDLDPAYFGEEPIRGLGRVTPERDRLEIPLTRLMLERDKPVFAICRGIQVLNVAMGGSLYQDLISQLETIQHTQQAPTDHLSHTVLIEEGTLLARLAKAPSSRVNSFHHQAVRQTAHGFRVSAVATDGVIEAIESVTHSFALGVQWHPEETAATDSFSAQLFSAFVRACESTGSYGD